MTPQTAQLNAEFSKALDQIGRAFSLLDLTRDYPGPAITADELLTQLAREWANLRDS